MIKGFFISNIDDRVVRGYLPKILGQVQAFINAGVYMTLLRFLDGHVAIRQGHTNVFRKQSDQILGTAKSAVSKRIRLFTNSYRILKTESFDFLYIRYTPFDPFLLVFLLLVRMKFNCKFQVLLEIPTYPYDKQYLSAGVISFSALQWMIDFFCRQLLCFMIDHFVIVNCDRNRVFRVPVISIKNGVDVEDFSLTGDLGRVGDPIHLVYVGNAGVWHGLDRLILGLSKYYEQPDSNKREVRLIVVGGGMSEETQNLSIRNRMQDYVSFMGARDGKDLDEIMQHATVGVGVLATHRLSSELFSPLKHREYCARGIPFIYDGNDDGFSEVEFALNVGMCDDPIDVDAVVGFVDKLRNENELPQIIQAYAAKNFSWSGAMSEVTSTIHGKKPLNRFQLPS